MSSLGARFSGLSEESELIELFTELVDFMKPWISLNFSLGTILIPFPQITISLA